MSRENRNILLLILTILVLIFVTSQFQSVDVEYGGEKGISPTASSFKLEASIYYLGEENLLVSERKNIIVEDNKLVNAIFKALKTEANDENLQILIDKNCKIISQDIFEQKLYLNVSSDIMNSPFWKEGKHQQVIYALVNSITQFDSIDKMQLKIDGRDIGYYLDDGNNYANMTFNPELNRAFTQSAESFLNEFLNLIKLKRYKQAYAMTLLPENEMPRTFIKDIDKYNREVGTYSIAKISTESEGNQIAIAVLYRLYDEVNKKYYDGPTKIWHVIEVSANNYKVLWYPDENNPKLSND